MGQRETPDWMSSCGFTALSHGWWGVAPTPPESSGSATHPLSDVGRRERARGGPVGLGHKGGGTAVVSKRTAVARVGNVIVHTGVRNPPSGRPKGPSPGGAQRAIVAASAVVTRSHDAFAAA